MYIYIYIYIYTHVLHICTLGRNRVVTYNVVKGRGRLTLCFQARSEITQKNKGTHKQTNYRKYKQ